VDRQPEKISARGGSATAEKGIKRTNIRGGVKAQEVPVKEKTKCTSNWFLEEKKMNSPSPHSTKNWKKEKATCSGRQSPIELKKEKNSRRAARGWKKGKNKESRLPCRGFFIGQETCKWHQGGVYRQKTAWQGRSITGKGCGRGFEKKQYHHLKGKKRLVDVLKKPTSLLNCGNDDEGGFVCDQGEGNVFGKKKLKLGGSIGEEERTFTKTAGEVKGKKLCP